MEQNFQLERKFKLFHFFPLQRNSFLQVGGKRISSRQFRTAPSLQSLNSLAPNNNLIYTVTQMFLDFQDGTKWLKDILMLSINL